jgi:methionyl-tRNA synthetase
VRRSRGLLPPPVRRAVLRGCEQFYLPTELVGGRCPEHGVAPEPVTEQNWFFRLSRYGEQVRSLLESGRVRIEPAARRDEVLSFVRAGLADFSVSRPAVRAGGWGIPVPGDPDQVVYVWWDALANYVTALGYGSDDSAYRRWWTGPGERVHVIGKGVVRFRAVYWLALLLSAGQPLPTAVYVHDYLTVGGAKLSKSAGNAVDPVRLVQAYGTDALRWWLLRDVAPVGDTDFTADRLIRCADQDLANGVGNLVNRTLTLLNRRRDGRVTGTQRAGALRTAYTGLPGRIDHAVAAFDLRAATGAVRAVVEEGNRYVETEQPWRQRDGDRLDGVLATLVDACRVVTRELGPFVPGGAERLRAQLGDGDRVGRPAPAFRRLGR